MWYNVIHAVQNKPISPQFNVSIETFGHPVFFFNGCKTCTNCLHAQDGYRRYKIADLTSSKNLVDLRNNVIFIFATLVRNWLVFIAFYFAPFAMFERTYATLKIQVSHKIMR